MNRVLDFDLVKDEKCKIQRNNNAENIIIASTENAELVENDAPATVARAESSSSVITQLSKP